jgi:hypothetical protein
MTRASRVSVRCLTRRAFALTGVLMVALATAACGDGEAGQRKAFIAFLQTRIIDKPGVHVPSLTDDEKSSIGVYYDQYMLIGDFNREMNGILTGPYKIAQTSAPRTMQELIARRTDVKAMAEAMARAGVDARTLLTDVNAKRAALKQPDDLKPIYAAAYERDVTAPAEAFLTTIPVAIEGMNKSLQLVAYLDAHRTTVKVNGTSIQASDGKTRAEVQSLLEAMNAQNQRLTAARERLRVVTTGK